MHKFDTFARIYLCSVSLSGNIADAVNVAEIGAFDREERKGIGAQEVAERVFLEVKDTLDDNGLDAYLVLGTVVELLFHQTMCRINQHFCGKNIIKLSFNRQTTDCTKVNSSIIPCKLFENKIKIAIFAPNKK